ncbi:MAG TPA: DUF4252 domain-containing protein [Vicinamibacterales bacterium]|nr:DUF4252 domain-containing protein [Vicinamibacterales bacterium]
MRSIITGVIATLIVASASDSRAQDITIPVNVERLAAKAVETVNVTVDGALLQLASKFLSSNDPEEKVAKNLIANLKGIYVRSFEFAEPDQYTEADVESLRSQLKAPTWSKMVSVTSKKDGENVEVFFKMVKEQIAGLVVIAAEPKELTFVNIVGPIDLATLSSLGGQFGIPKLDLEEQKK